MPARTLTLTRSAGGTTTHQPTRAVLYMRVSSKDQEAEGFSIPAQVRLLREYAASKGFVIEAEFVDVETAKASGRTHFSEMLAFVKKHHASCRTILVEKTDRLYRNLKDWVTLDDLDVEIHFVKENEIVSRSSGSSAKLIHGIKVLMAKNVIDNLSEETQGNAGEGPFRDISKLCPGGLPERRRPQRQARDRARARHRGDHQGVVCPFPDWQVFSRESR